MAILNRITVGFKQVLEVDADPTLTATPAPIGSEAFFDDAGVGKSYLKFGALDTQWASYQTGAEPSDWKFTTDANQLNVATAKAYFGTKTGSNFDIEFQRNGEVEMLLKATEVEFFKDIRLNGSDRYIRSANSLYVESNFLGLSSVGTMRLSAGIYQRRIDASGFTSELTEYTSAVRETISDVASTYQIPVASTNTGNNTFFEIKVFLQALNGANKADVIVKKTAHVDRDGVLFIQDDFTSKNQYAQSTMITLGIDSNQLVVLLSGLSGLTSKIAKVEVKRLGSE